MVVLTREMLLLARSERGGWPKRPLAVLGVSWPLQKGWQYKLVGREFPEDVIQRFLEVCGHKQLLLFGR